MNCCRRLSETRRWQALGEHRQRQKNPVAAGLVTLAEEYHYSSAKFYETGVDDFNFITHFRGN